MSSWPLRVGGHPFSSLPPLTSTSRIYIYIYIYIYISTPRKTLLCHRNAIENRHLIPREFLPSFTPCFLLRQSCFSPGGDRVGPSHLPRHQLPDSGSQRHLLETDNTRQAISDE